MTRSSFAIAANWLRSTSHRTSSSPQNDPISSPFHSQWIEQAKGEFVDFMQSVRFERGRLPLICCDRAETLSDLPDGYFWGVVRHPIRFREATARLEREGARRYIDVG